MPTYRYVSQYGKPMYRASIIPTVMGKKPDGSDIVINQPGPMGQIKPGTLLTDVQPDELEAFGDHFELVTEDELKAMAKAAEEAGVSLPSLMAPLRGVHEPASGPDAVVQKPPLTGPEVAAAKAAQAAVRKVQQEQAPKRQELDEEMQAASQKAMDETFMVEVEKAQAAASATPPVPGAVPPKAVEEAEKAERDEKAEKAEKAEKDEKDEKAAASHASHASQSRQHR
jgi:hypothetical protein